MKKQIRFASKMRKYFFNKPITMNKAIVCFAALDLWNVL